jgi:DNA-binding NarL/FixJ family response regulator
MATILLCGVDLFVRGKLEAVLPEHRFTTSDSVEAPDLVVADIARIDAEDVADSFPDVPILGYTNHTDTAGLRRANAAGFDKVVAKSALFERARELVDGLISSVE